MRAFLAIEIPAAIRSALGDAQRELAAGVPGWRWARPDGIHLTLRFLGEIAPKTIETATPLWRAAASSIEPFTIRVAGLGVFPSARRPRVLWAGVAEEPPAGRLAAVAERIGTASAAAGLGREARPFTPHLTLGRAAGGAGVPPPAGRTLDCGSAAIVEVVLFRSELRPPGAVHTAIARLPLAGPRP